VKVKRRQYDRSKGRGLRFQDHAGEQHGRLLCLEWLGRWKKRSFWRAQCDCGRTVELRWRAGILSCGCLNEEAGQMRDFRVQRIDGTWGHVNAKRIVLADGRRFETVHELAQCVGISDNAMHHRLHHWPAERWLEPGMPRGRGEKKHRRRIMDEKHAARLTRKPQPWAVANIAKANERNRHARARASQPAVRDRPSADVRPGPSGVRPDDPVPPRS
jgi:hypothetical protein